MAAHRTSDATRPASRALAITPSDATVLEVTRGLYIGTTGDVVVDMAEQGTSITFANVASGQILPIQVTKVRAATGASNIIALY
jgi:hypothetical protein